MRMTLQPRKLALALASAAMLALAGCGGGGSGGGTPTAGTTGVPVTVVDDAIGNATVCLDKNLNGICDAGEPSGKTDAAGNVTLQVPTEDVGKYPILAVVGTDAVDAKYGPVTTRFTMQAPADKPAVVSPLTTLVQSQIASTGATSAQAEASVKAQTGINVSLFEDYSKGTTADSQAAGTVARMVVVTTQQQASTLSSTVGTTAIDGAVIKQADLDKIIQNKLLEILPALLTALADPSVQAATTPAAKEAALLAQANALVASPSTGLTTASVATLVAINNQTAPTATVVADVPTAGANLRLLNFTDVNNWVSRVFVSTLAQATPDASGFQRSVQRRYSTQNGQTAAWTNIGGNPARQSDLHFNGSAWVGCALNFENLNTVRNAQGNSTYNDCDNNETGTSNRASFDIAGRTMLEVYNQVNAAGYQNLTISNPSTALGTATFPTGSKLFYQSSTSQSTALAYYPGSGNLLNQYSAAVSAGGVASSQPAGVGCNSTEFNNTNGTASVTLESMIAAMTGTPCIFPQGSFTYNTQLYTSPDPVDEAWSNSTVGIGTLGTAPVGTGATAPGYYSGNTRLRVAFKGTGTNPVTYYSCKERFINSGSPRNCTAIGTGSYTITTQGDARVMTLSNPPLIATGLGYQRVFVERGGKIHLGYKNNLGTTNSARLNLPATNALLTQLGLPTVDVNVPLTLTAASYQSTWDLTSSVLSQSATLNVGANGLGTCTQGGAATACTLSFTNLATGAFTLAGINGSTTGTLDFLTSQVAATYTTPAGTFTGLRR